MRIGHVGIWTHDLERLRSFYERYFDARAGERYTSARRPFHSYLLTFESGAALELMSLEGLAGRAGTDERAGYAHIAFATGSPEAVDHLTARLAADGIAVMSAPRRTGDGFYESVVADPDGNLVEITE